MRAARVDNNQRDIVAQLRQIPGVSVEVIGKPLDLLVGYQGRTWLVEIKNEDGLNRLTKDQGGFITRWTGGFILAHSFEEAWDEIKGRSSGNNP